MGFIYTILNPNDRLYVGQTYSVKQRMYSYKSLRHRNQKSIIIASIKKYGWSSHIFNIIEEIPDELMNEREIFWINKLDTFFQKNPNGMNLTQGGGGCRMSWKEDKERVAKAKLRVGANAPTFGRKTSDDEKIKISISVSKYNKENNKKPSEYCHQKALEKRMRQIICYNLNGDLVGEYSSIKLAANKLGIDRKTANDNLNGKQYHGGGYIFKSKTENYPLKIQVDKSKILLRRRPILCFFDGEPIAEFPTLKKVSEELNLKFGTVEDAFYGNRITRDGFYFIYKDLYEEILKTAS